MKHLEICRRYFDTLGRPMIERNFPRLVGRYAAGMVGEGSGCFGFDDEISRDHDFGPGFAYGSQTMTTTPMRPTYPQLTVSFPVISWV